MQVFIFISNTDFDPPKRIIILSNENRTRSSQLSTAAVIQQQIPTNFRINNDATTPFSLRVSHNQEPIDTTEHESLPQKLEFRSYPNMFDELRRSHNYNIYPNHRYDGQRQSEENIQPRPFDYFVRGTPPTAFQLNHKNSSSMPQIPKEYEGTVNSIQDILKQMSDGKNNYQESNGMHKIKIAGTYKHRKLDDITEIFESAQKSNREKNVERPVTHTYSSTNADNVIRDPFYKYKPNSLSDVNLMATNQFRFAPYHILSNKFVPTSSTLAHAMDPGNLYHQIIMANANRLKYLDDKSKNDNVQSKQKPFTLMLDVYPMPNDEHISPTSSQPVKYQNQFNSHTMRHPGISSLNSLQSHFQNANYPQLNRYPNLPHYNNPNYFRKFGARPLNSGFHASTNDREINGNNPSQITVHLNLFPKKKERSNSQNREIYNKNDNVVREEGVRFEDRMVKLSDKVNQTEKQKDSQNVELTNVQKVSNKVDMEMLQGTTTVATLNQNDVTVDDNSDSTDSSEDIFIQEFLQSPSTYSPPEYSTTTLEAKSDDSSEFRLIPTILPIEPREYNHQIDKSLVKPITVHQTICNRTKC